MIKKTNILESNLFATRVFLYNQSILPSTDVIQLTLTLKMTAQVVETLVNVNNNSSIQDYVYSDDETQPTFEMTPGLKPFINFHMIIGGRKEYSRTSRYGHLSNTDSSLLRTVSNVLRNSHIFSLKETSIIPTFSNTDNRHEISAPESNFI